MANRVELLRQLTGIDDLNLTKDTFKLLGINYTEQWEEEYKGVRDCHADGVVTIITVKGVEFIFNGFNQLQKVDSA